MKDIHTHVILYLSIIIIISVSCVTDNEDPADPIRNDTAQQLTYSNDGESAQNPAFSPDGNYVLFTRFINGYNNPPSELVKININSGEETVVVAPQGNVEHINAPGSSWINGKICWSSDLAGQSNEIYVANDDGSEIVQVTNHPEPEGYYIEPVFNPSNTNKIIFETGISDNGPHRIAIVELDENNKVTYLTSDSSYDDRLPNWSPDGQTILFQRASSGGENWQIFTAKVNFAGTYPSLSNVTKINQPDAANTDNSWYYNNVLILSSTKYNSSMPNIYLLPINGDSPSRITNTDTNEDGAPSCSPDGKHVAFETHQGEDEEYPSEIWIIDI